MGIRILNLFHSPIRSAKENMAAMMKIQQETKDLNKKQQMNKLQLK